MSSDTFRNRNHSYTDISGFSPRIWKISPETSECWGQYSWWQWHPLWIPQQYQIPKEGNFIGHNMWYVIFVFWDICWIPNSIFCFPISLVAPEYAELLYTHRRNDIRIYPTAKFSCNLLYPQLAFESQFPKQRWYLSSLISKAIGQSTTSLT